MKPHQPPGIFKTRYEHKCEPIAERSVFLKRVFTHFLWTLIILGSCLLMGIIGYKFTGPMSWIDAVHNASMILRGMGPVVIIETFWGKIFSSFYALFSGVIFITSIGILIAPIAHRFFHKMNLED
jgi:hypothetical protein